MVPIRGFFIWFFGVTFVLIPLILFSMGGWPRHPDSCTNINAEHVQELKKIPGTDYPDIVHPDTCYCEAFKVEDVVEGHKGIRQKTNTWSNLYAIATSLLVVFMVYRDRKKRTGKNVFHDPLSWIPELYVFCVLFLGLGSMWLHASLSASVSWLDGMSMYVFTAFLPVYTLRRRLTMKYWFFPLYLGIVATFTILNVLPGFEKASIALVGTIVLAYFIAEFFVKCRDMERLGCDEWFDRLRIGLCGRGAWMRAPLMYWSMALGSFVLATIFRGLSQTGGPMCYPDSWFQPHGLMWHSLSGVMALMLYFYWRCLPDEDLRALRPRPTD